MEIRREDVFAPANAISAVGAALTLAGATNIDRPLGVAMIGIGRTLDLLDGPIARRTHTSEFGAAVDGTLDKLGVAVLVAQGIRHDIVHPEALLLIAAFNVVNGVANVYIEHKGQEPKTSRAGKYNMFGYNLAIGGFALAHALGGNTGLEVAAGASFVASTPIAVKASYDYTKQALRVRSIDNRQKNHQRRKR